jgi:hypothetical protein
MCFLPFVGTLSGGVPTKKRVFQQRPTKKGGVPTGSRCVAYYIYYLLSLYYILYSVLKTVFVGTLERWNSFSPPIFVFFIFLFFFIIRGSEGENSRQ